MVIARIYTRTLSNHKAQKTRVRIRKTLHHRSPKPETYRKLNIYPKTTPYRPFNLPVSESHRRMALDALVRDLRLEDRSWRELSIFGEIVVLRGLSRPCYKAYMCPTCSDMTACMYTDTYRYVYARRMR